MTIENYLMVSTTTNTVESVCVWNGDTNTWTPPANTLMLPQANTSAMVWELNTDKTEYVLTQQLGKADIGFTWDGTVCTTNQPKPEIPA